MALRRSSRFCRWSLANSDTIMCVNAMSLASRKKGLSDRSGGGVTGSRCHRRSDAVIGRHRDVSRRSSGVTGVSSRSPGVTAVRGCHGLSQAQEVSLESYTCFRGHHRYSLLFCSIADGSEAYPRHALPSPAKLAKLAKSAIDQPTCQVLRPLMRQDEGGAGGPDQRVHLLCHLPQPSSSTSTMPRHHPDLFWVKSTVRSTRRVL